MIKRAFFLDRSQCGLRLVTLAALAGSCLFLGCNASFSPGAGENESTAPGPFDGEYVLDGGRSGNVAEMVFSPLVVKGHVLRYGAAIVGEFELLNPTVSDDKMEGDAIWYEDRDDPGDSTRVKVAVTKQGTKLTLRFTNEDGQARLVYKRKGA